MFVPKEKIESIYSLLKDKPLNDIIKMDEYKEYMPYLIISKLFKTYPDDKELLIKLKDYYLNEYKMPDKILIISDNHLGRLYNDEYLKYKIGIKKDIYKNEDSLAVAYNYAIKNNINTVLHAGDIIEGNSDNTRHSMEVKEQILYLRKLYSCLNNIKTYLLLGNHDYESICFDGIDEKDFMYIKNLEVIGVNHSYVSMDDRLIKVIHESKVSNFLLMPEYESEFELYGHKHFFTFNKDDRQITLSSLTNINEWNEMGFLELQNEEKEFVFKNINTNGRLINEYRLEKK